MRLLCLLFVTVLAVRAAESDAVEQAIGALQHGDFASAEQTLRAHLKQQPSDAAALDVLGVVLDQQRKFAEADQVYHRATALDPRSPSLLNNYGNHLIASGRLKEARAVFAKVLALNPAQTNAAIQLAHIDIEQKNGAEALRRLEALPAAAKDTPNAVMLTMQADYLLGRNKEADAIFDRVSSQADPRELGDALAAVGQYARAEALYSRAVEAAPGEFGLLYRLGLAAAHAGDNDRALEVLQSALAKQPQNVDVLYDLAAVNAAMKRNEEALRVLGQAARLAPDRPDVQRLVARTTAELGYFNDAIQAWNRYLKLVPGDDTARRERAFAETAVGASGNTGLADLRAYLAKHPNDAVGHYELGVSESATNAAGALAQFDKALALKPDLTAVHIARGLLRYRENNPAAALADFEFVAKREPENPVVLDRLAQTYIALDRSADAVPLLRKAADLSPRDSRILMHLGRALSNTGQADEAKLVFQRFRELGPEKASTARPAGLVEFVGLSPQEQMARYRAGVERTVQANPENAEAQVRWLELLLGEGNATEAAAVARHIATLKPSAALLSEAASALLAAEQYTTAKEFLDSAGPFPERTLDLAIAAFHLESPRAGLEQLDRVPEAQRSGDYYLARADMLGAAGRLDEAYAALDHALRASPKRPDLYRRAALFLIRHQRAPQALQLLDRGATVVSENAGILLLKAVALELCAKTADAERLLGSIEDRWPEWPNAWAVHGVILHVHKQDQQSRRMLETAAQLAPIDAGISNISAALAKGSPSGAWDLIDPLFR